MEEKSEHPNARSLAAASSGFDHLFSNNITGARTTFQAESSPFHLLGLGVCSFLEAALGMEAGLMEEASRCLSLSEAEAKKQSKVGKTRAISRFAPGLEWEIVAADAVVLLGLTHALSESYMGYLQCIYSLNSAHGKFTKLYKTVFPAGLDQYATPATTPAISRKPSSTALSSATSAASTIGRSSTFFGRWNRAPSSSSHLTVSGSPALDSSLDGPVEEMIVSGTAFGYGLFNLVFSLLPKKVQGVVGFFGFRHDRKAALQALAVSSAKTDVHSVFAGLVLMTYHGVVLLLSGYQADETHIIKQYRAIVDKIEPRYPEGALWILNRAKILRMSHDAEGAIRVLQDGLRPNRHHSFMQADTLLVFELAWTLLGQRRYKDAAEMFIKITELNSWSHATYYFIAAGCYISLGNLEKAQGLMNSLPALLDKKKINGKDLPTEVLIKKKLEFYKAKQVRRGGSEKDFVQAIQLSPAEEIGIFWNTHARIDKELAEQHIREWASITPAISTSSPVIETNNTTLADLDTPDELSLRSLLLGINHRTAQHFAAAREFLVDAHERQPQIKTSTWIGGMALFELAVLALKEVEFREREGESKQDPHALTPEWSKALDEASRHLDQAYTLVTNSVDLSSRLDSRIAMLREEIALKKELLKLGGPGA